MESSPWLNGVDHELAFWEGVLQKQVEQGLNLRFPRVRDLQYLADAGCIAWPPANTVRCLDVGSGPFADFGMPSSDIPAEFIYTDALGNTYNRLLTKYNFVNMPRIRHVRGEDLVEAFGEATFDHVNCSNALDHCDDPKRTFDQMVSVCKVGGLITVVSIENEGEGENYAGFHQWNLAVEDGKVLLWNRKEKTDLLDKPSYNLSFDWSYVDHGQTDCKIIMLNVIRGR